MTDIQPMAYAVYGEPASSAEYNKVVDNVKAVDSRNVNQDSWITNHDTVVHSALESRLNTIETNIGTRGANGTIYTEIEALKAGSGGGTGIPPGTVADDTKLYGDIISTQARRDSVWGEPLAPGFMTAFATKSTKTFTANKLRIAVVTAGVDGATFDLSFYVGTNASALPEKFWTYGRDIVTSTGVKEFTLPGVPINEGDFVAVCMILTGGWSTLPRFSSTSASPGAEILINAGQQYAIHQGGQTYPLPHSLNLNAPLGPNPGDWKASNQLYWFAVA